MDASKRISDLIVISQRLADVLARENRALRENRRDEVQALLEQKDELSRAYESRIKGLAENAGAPEMAEVDPSLKEQLRDLGEEIQRLTEENVMRLQVAMEVNRRVLDEVAEAIKSSQATPAIYSNTGAHARDHERKASGTVSISLDRSL